MPGKWKRTCPLERAMGILARRWRSATGPFAPGALQAIFCRASKRRTSRRTGGVYAGRFRRMNSGACSMQRGNGPCMCKRRSNSALPDRFESYCTNSEGKSKTKLFRLGCLQLFPTILRIIEADSPDVVNSMAPTWANKRERQPNHQRSSPKDLRVPGTRADQRPR